VYENLSGYVHFSGSHVAASIVALDEETREVSFHIGKTDEHYPPFSWIEVLNCAHEATGILARYLLGYIRTKAMSPEGQQRITDTIAKQFKVDPSVVTNLRNRRIGFGEATVALAFSQELMKQDKSLTQQRALDQVLAKRAGGEGWGRIAQDLGLKLGRVRAEVERAEKKVARLDRRDKVDKDKGEAVERADKADKLESKPVRMDRPEKSGRSGR